jgi:hypothetical protein
MAQIGPELDKIGSASTKQSEPVQSAPDPIPNESKDTLVEGGARREDTPYPIDPRSIVMGAGPSDSWLDSTNTTWAIERGSRRTRDSEREVSLKPLSMPPMKFLYAVTVDPYLRGEVLRGESSMHKVKFLYAYMLYLSLVRTERMAEICSKDASSDEIERYRTLRTRICQVYSVIRKLVPDRNNLSPFQDFRAYVYATKDFLPKLDSIVDEILRTAPVGE